MSPGRRISKTCWMAVTLRLTQSIQTFQAACVHGRRPLDVIATMRQLIELTLEWDVAENMLLCIGLGLLLLLKCIVCLRACRCLRCLSVCRCLRACAGLQCWSFTMAVPCSSNACAPACGARACAFLR